MSLTRLNIPTSPTKKSKPPQSKPVSPGRTPVEKTNLTGEELTKMLDEEIARKKELMKKTKAPQRLEKKLETQLKTVAKAMAKPQTAEKSEHSKVHSQPTKVSGPIFSKTYVILMSHYSNSI